MRVILIIFLFSSGCFASRVTTISLFKRNTLLNQEKLLPNTGKNKSERDAPSSTTQIASTPGQ